MSCKLCSGLVAQQTTVEHVLVSKVKPLMVKYHPSIMG
jgi:hypothetical protein